MTSTQQRAELQRRIWRRLPDDKQLYYSRIINFTSHSTLSNEALAVPTPAEQATVKLLTDHLKSRHAFWQQQGA